MDYEKLLDLATPFLEKNDLGVAHTKRVLDLAKSLFSIPPEIEALTISTIILHDIGGSSIKDQYEKGPAIATTLLKTIGCKENFINQVCTIISTHHKHPENPQPPFKILYDADKLAMFSAEEFPTYNTKENFDWNKIINQLYTQKAKNQAKQTLKQQSNR